MLAREFESVETSPGLASPYLVSLKMKKSLNYESLVFERCNFTKKPGLSLTLLKKAKNEQKS